MTYELARKNMVECQLQTNGIINENILNAFRDVPRELFLPDSQRKSACVDEDIPLDKGYFLLEPMIHAQMLQAVKPMADDVVLSVGDCTGYGAGILSNMVSTVVEVYAREGAIQNAKKIWDKQGYCNIAPVKSRAIDGSPDHAPYSMIIVHGAVTQIPENLVAQLSPNGRLVCVVKAHGKAIGQLTLVKKTQEDALSTVSICDAAVPYIQEMLPEPEFVF